MEPVLIILALLALVAAAGWWHKRRRRARREAIRDRMLPEPARRILRDKVPLYTALPEELRRKLDGVMQVFLDEMSFEAHGGLGEVTDEMRLVIASQACLLLLESGYRDFGRLRSVLIYPDAYRVKDEFGMEDIRLGESWDTGSVVLSWQSVMAGSRNPEDGLNVVLHEFAHQIDQVDGEADGLPVLKRRGDYREWARAFGASYQKLCDRVERGKPTVLDDYGAENPAELFAVATETFFEKPSQLEREHAAVYEQLKRFYGLDPLAWV